MAYLRYPNCVTTQLYISDYTDPTALQHTTPTPPTSSHSEGPPDNKNKELPALHSSPPPLCQGVDRREKRPCTKHRGQCQMVFIALSVAANQSFLSSFLSNKISHLYEKSCFWSYVVCLL
mmetsp:Transcript_19101/g.31272  ORF Transcript_19101/g.31272 Transcript_19101/m.31272 type:complete len:120 (+) Transcript_19101:659-1018(+)